MFEVTNREREQSVYRYYDTSSLVSSYNETTSIFPSASDQWHTESFPFKSLPRYHFDNLSNEGSLGKHNRYSIGWQRFKMADSVEGKFKNAFCLFLFFWLTSWQPRNYLSQERAWCVRDQNDFYLSSLSLPCFLMFWAKNLDVWVNESAAPLDTSVSHSSTLW